MWERFFYSGDTASSTYLVSQKVNWIGNTSTQDYRYTYDVKGNILSEYNTKDNRTQTYTYDIRNQLTGVVDNKNGTVRTESYTYDDYGNILTFQSGNISHTLTYGDTAGWGDLLTAVDSNAITYDGIGNPLTYYNGATMVWEHGRQLASITNGSSTTAFTYDRNGTRLRKDHPDGTWTEYYVIGGTAVGETLHSANGANQYWLRYLFDEQGAIVGFSYWGSSDTAWSEFYFARNLQGDVVQIYRASNHALVATYSYDLSCY